MDRNGYMRKYVINLISFGDKMDVEGEKEGYVKDIFRILVCEVKQMVLIIEIAKIGRRVGQR